MKTILIIIFILGFSILKSTEKNLSINSQILEFYIENKIENFYLYYNETNKTEHIMFLDSKNNSIFLYNYPEVKLIDKITPNFEIGGILLIDSLNVLINEFNTYNFYIYSFKSNNFIDTVYSNILKDFEGYICFTFCNNLIQYDGKNIYFNAVINVSPPKFFNYNCLGKIDLKDSSIKIFGDFPEKMKDGNVWLDFYPNFCRKGDELLISFNPDSMIYIYDLNGNFKYSKEVKSKYVDEILPPDSGQTMNTNLSMHYQIKTPLYHNILYDKYRKVFYRVVTQANDFYNIDGTVTEYFSQAFSIIIFDEDYKILDELYFQNGIYDFTKILVTKDGLLVGHKVEGNSMKFNLITIKR